MGVYTISPGDGRVVAERPFADRQVIERAVQSARTAQQQWRQWPLSKRVEAVAGALQFLCEPDEQRHAELSWQMGRPISQVAGEFRGVRQRGDYMLGIAETALQAVHSHAGDALQMKIVREPLGVILAITPWNYPYLTAVNTLVPALVAGNAVLLKPSPQTPLTGEHFAAAFAAAGLPDGLFQCLHLSADSTLQLVANPAIDHIAFTGSTQVGQQVEHAAAGRFVSLGLELGGKDAAYVRHDADFGMAAENLADGAFYNAGQSCCAVERIYVHHERYEEFVDALVHHARQQVLGDPLHAETTLGPVVNQAAADRIRRDIAAACAAGAECLVPETEFPAAQSGTCYVAPQVLVSVNHQMAIMREETFGPVVGVMAVADDSEAIAYMNDSPYGLTASLWSADQQVAESLAGQLEVGTVYLNRCDVLEPALAWTGVKQSGRGCTLSALGYHALTRPKSLNFRPLNHTARQPDPVVAETV